MTQSGPNTRPALIAYHLFWNAVDWVFPPRCGGCDQSGERWCEDCQQKVTRLGETCCECCGEPLEQPGLCEQCRRRPPAFKALRSWCAYRDPARQAIHRLKYRRDIGLAEALAAPLLGQVHALGWKIDVVTSVPLSPARLRQRGYNQASMLAYPVALSLGKPFRAGLLVRNRDTASQVGLSAAERERNVQGAFSARPVPGQSILVIDDVITTGSTMNACAQALQAAGATAVYGLSYARAIIADHSVPIHPFS